MKSQAYLRDLPTFLPSASRGSHNQAPWCQRVSGPSWQEPWHYQKVCLLLYLALPPLLLHKGPFPFTRKLPSLVFLVSKPCICALNPTPFGLFSGLAPSLVVSLRSLTLCLCWLFNISMCENARGPGGHRAKGSKPGRKTDTAWPHLHVASRRKSGTHSNRERSGGGGGGEEMWIGGNTFSVRRRISVGDLICSLMPVVNSILCT